MIIIITGNIGIGKTTVCRKFIEIVRGNGHTCGGILTYRAADSDIIIEDIQSGEKEILASINRVYDGPSTPKYSFNPGGITFGIQAIDRGTSAAVLVVDEIGHLELRGEGFANVLELVSTGKVKDCLLVIRRELLTAFLPQLRLIPLVFETTISSRNQLPQAVGSVLLEKMR
ncbi:nucleoside-triphosphatase [Chloroflexota bacterium]